MTNKNPNRVNHVKIVQVLFTLNAVIWLSFGLYTLFGMADRYPGQTIIVYVFGYLMLGNVGAMVLSGYLTGKPKRSFFYFGVFVLVMNIMLTVTDQFGFFDLVTLLIDLILLALLISLRKQYH